MHNNNNIQYFQHHYFGIITTAVINIHAEQGLFHIPVKNVKEYQKAGGCSFQLNYIDRFLLSGPF
jgi:hypothetical protein